MFRIAIIIVTALGVGCTSSGGKRKAEAAPNAESGSSGASSGTSDYGKIVSAARGHLQRGNTKGALKAISRAVKADPKRHDAYFLWGWALAVQEKFPAAIKKYEKARKLGARSREFVLHLSTIYDRVGQYAKAVEVYRWYLKRAPKDAELWNELGLSLVGLGDTDGAVMAIEKARALVPKNQRVAQDLGYVLLVARKFPRAIEVIEPFTRGKNPSPTMLMFLAKAYAGNGELSRSMQILSPLVDGPEANAQAIRLRAQLNYLYGTPGDALNDYLLLAEIDPNDIGAWIGAAGCFIRLRKLKDAQGALDKAKGAGQENPAILFRQAQIDWHRVKKESAATVIIEFARKHPRNVEAWQQTFRIAVDRGDRSLQEESEQALQSLGVTPGRT